MKAIDVIARALRLLSVIGESEAPTAEQARDALDVLETLLAELRDSDIDVADYAIADVQTDLTITRGEKDVFAYQIALRLSPEFGKSLSPEFIKSMETSWSRFLLNHFQPGVVSFSDLPAESGRYYG